MSKIKSITRKQINDEHLYNLAVLDDESFICDGIIVHNCKSYLTPQFKGVKKNKPVSAVGLRPTGTEKQIETMEKQITLKEN